MIKLFNFTYTDEQWDAIRMVVRDRLDLDADQIEHPYEQRVMLLKQCFCTSGMRSLRSCIETAAYSHILRSARESQTPGHKVLVKQLTALRNRAKALHVDFKDEIAPTVTVEGDEIPVDAASRRSARRSKSRRRRAG